MVHQRIAGHRRRPAGPGDARRDAPRGRDRDGPGQVRRVAPVRGLRALDVRPDDGPDRHGERPPAGDRARRAAGPLPAAGRPDHGPDRRLRGARPLAASGPRPGPAARLHPARGGDRADHAARAVGAGDRLSPGDEVARRPPQRPAPADVGQPVRSPVRPGRPRRPGRRDPDRDRDGPDDPGARDHRERRDGPVGRRHPDPRPPARHGRPARARRLRHRLFVAVVPQAPAARHDQDRPDVRDGARGRGGSLDRGRGHLARPRPAHQRRRRRHRDRDPVRDAAGDGLRHRPGLPVREAAAGRRRDPAAAHRAAPPWRPAPRSGRSRRRIRSRCGRSCDPGPREPRARPVGAQPRRRPA